MDIAGVLPPLETTGLVPVTLVTVPTEIEPPRLVLVPLIVIALFVRLELPMFDSVLLAPEIVLLVKVCAPVNVATVESIAIVPLDVIVPPDKPVPAVIEVTVPPLDGLVLVIVKLG